MLGVFKEYNHMHVRNNMIISIMIKIITRGLLYWLIAVRKSHQM